MVLAVVDDLLFSSRIRAVATTAGVPLVVARTHAAALEALRGQSPELVVLDLEAQSFDSVAIVRAIRAEGGSPPRIVGFGSHVNVDRLQQAREAGCDQAMARSAFVASLPALLAAAAPGAR